MGNSNPKNAIIDLSESFLSRATVLLVIYTNMYNIVFGTSICFMSVLYNGQKRYFFANIRGGKNEGWGVASKSLDKVR